MLKESLKSIILALCLTLTFASESFATGSLLDCALNGKTDLATDTFSPASSYAKEFEFPEYALCCELAGGDYVPKPEHDAAICEGLSKPQHDILNMCLDVLCAITGCY